MCRSGCKDPVPFAGPSSSAAAADCVPVAYEARLPGKLTIRYLTEPLAQAALDAAGLAGQSPVPVCR